MNRTALLGALALLVTTASPGLAQRSNPRMSFEGQSIDEMIADFMAENQIPGMAVAIVQAPYIPRITGFGVADTAKRLLVSSNTMFDIGQMAHAYTAVAVMQLVEMGKLELEGTVDRYLRDLPAGLRGSTVRQLVQMADGDAVDGALVRLIETASGMTYSEFVRKHQIERLGLRHTVFAHEMDRVKSEAVERNNNKHRHFLTDAALINPTEVATGYPRNDDRSKASTSGMATIFASAMDISIWDIGLAGGILIGDAELRAVIYQPPKAADGTQTPVSGAWRFPGRKGLMYTAGNARGYSAFLSRFTDPSELVCVTLLANKEGLDLTQLARRIAGAYDPRLGPSLVHKGMRLQQSPFNAATTRSRMAPELAQKGIVWEDNGQVWIGYAADAMSHSERERFDRMLLEAVTPY